MLFRKCFSSLPTLEGYSSDGPISAPSTQRQVFAAIQTTEQHQCPSSGGSSMLIGANGCRFAGEPRGAALLFSSITTYRVPWVQPSCQWQGPVTRPVMKRNSWTGTAIMMALELSWTPRENLAFPTLMNSLASQKSPRAFSRSIHSHWNPGPRGYAIGCKLSSPPGVAKISF